MVAIGYGGSERCNALNSNSCQGHSAEATKSSSASRSVCDHAGGCRQFGRVCTNYEALKLIPLHCTAFNIG